MKRLIKIATIISLTSHRSCLILLSFLLCINLLASAQTYQSGQTSVNNGSATTTSTSYQTHAIIGQPAISTTNSTSFQVITGFGPAFLSAKIVDVSISNIQLDPSTVGPGNSLTFAFDINSLETSSIDANTLDIAVYLSTDQVIDAGELLKTVTVTNLIAGSTTYAFPQTGDDNDLTIGASETPGDYYLIFELDPANTIGETNETNNELSAALTISNDTTSPVIGTVAKDNFYSTGSTASVSVNDNVGVDKVYFYHRGIRATNSSNWGTPVEVQLVSGVYSVTLESSWLDELGIEFWFEAFDTSNNRDSTEVHFTYYQTVGNELILPNFPAGRKQTNYRIFSIPFDLTQKNPTTVFSKLGPYDPVKWRMYHYLNGSTLEYNKGWSSIDPGKSYWLIHDVADAGQILVGEGDAIQGNKASPYTINLVQGWNQIGNPYRFDVSWNDILSASGNPTEVERFRVWNTGSFSDGSTLATYGGGFVFTSAPVQISIPVSTGSGGRVSELAENKNPLNSDSWQVIFEIKNGDLQFNLGGFGMHPDALNGKDYYDDVAMPRLPEYVDINFSHPEYFITRFNKDVVPSNDLQTWYFTIDKNSQVKATILSWDNSYFGDNGMDLYMIDMERNTLLNMRETNTYTFTMDNQYRFKVIYGDEFAIREDLVPNRVTLGQNYPNPFIATTLIPIALPDTKDKYNIELVVMNKLGQEVKQVFSGDLGPGYHQFEWDGKDMTGEKTTPGFYVYLMKVNTGNEIMSYAKYIVRY